MKILKAFIKLSNQFYSFFTKISICEYFCINFMNFLIKVCYQCEKTLYDALLLNLKIPYLTTLVIVDMFLVNLTKV